MYMYMTCTVLINEHTANKTIPVIDNIINILHVHDMYMYCRSKQISEDLNHSPVDTCECTLSYMYMYLMYNHVL